MGNPDDEKPQGIEMAGSPRALNGRVFAELCGSWEP
jgi:hypothetical protein